MVNGSQPLPDYVTGVDFRSDETITLVRTTRQYETSRDLLDYIENIWRPEDQSPATISKYDYTTDPRGRAASDPRPARRLPDRPPCAQ